jgi:hypothetical protein
MNQFKVRSVFSVLELDKVLNELYQQDYFITQVFPYSSSEQKGCIVIVATKMKK